MVGFNFAEQQLPGVPYRGLPRRVFPASQHAQRASVLRGLVQWTVHRLRPYSPRHQDRSVDLGPPGSPPNAAYTGSSGMRCSDVHVRGRPYYSVGGHSCHTPSPFCYGHFTLVRAPYPAELGKGEKNHVRPNGHLQSIHQHHLQ